jgi:hypothetical protein
MEQVQALNIDVINGTINPVAKTRDAGDDSLWVTFEMASHFDGVATRETGRPIFKMEEYIKIVVPGDTTTVIHRPVRPGDMERFPRQYQAFKIGAEQQQGYPLSEWPHINRAQVDELAYFKIQTVEQLASVSDTVTQKFVGLNQLREKAKQYLERMNSEAPTAKLEAEIKNRDEQLSAQQAQIDALNEAIRELQAAQEDKARKRA